MLKCPQYFCIIFWSSNQEIHWTDDKSRLGILLSLAPCVLILVFISNDNITVLLALLNR